MLSISVERCLEDVQSVPERYTYTLSSKTPPKQQSGELKSGALGGRRSFETILSLKKRFMTTIETHDMRQIAPLSLRQDTFHEPER